MGIPENIKKLREKNGLTQEELGKIAQVSGKAVSAWENGTKVPRMAAIQRLASYFGLLKSDLIEDGVNIQDPRAKTKERLKSVMDARGLRQVDVVSLCKPFCEKYNVKIDKPHISQYLSGSARPSPERISILSKALGVDESWLMGYGDYPNEKLYESKRETSELKEELLEMIDSLTEQEAAVYLAALKSVLKRG